MYERVLAAAKLVYKLARDSVFIFKGDNIR